MLSAIIRTALNNRLLTLAAAVLLSALGLHTALTLPIDVLPDLTRPTVTVLTEAHGLAPEEVERQVTFHIENSVNGATGVERVRSFSGLGISMVFVEFGWDTDLWRDRQIVQERLTTISEKMPEHVIPQMGPVGSLMGDIMLMGLQAPDTDPMALRTLADWVVRPALLSVKGVSQVSVIGGDLREFQVRADPERLRQFELTLGDLETALGESNLNSGGGFIVGPTQETAVRNIGRVHTREDIEDSLIAMRRSGDHGTARPIRVQDVAEVVEAGRLVKRGDGSINGSPAVLLSIQKSPNVDTRALTARIDDALDALRPSLPDGLMINRDLFRQAHFINRAIHNVFEALRDGSILVIIILALFLMNARTTLITLSALPLSLLITALVFDWFGLTLNTMTLGGIAVAVGALVDDAIVNVENVYRRLNENRQAAKPRRPLQVVYEASLEVRAPILYGTVLVLLVFLPLFFLQGLEGRLFAPLAVGYITSVLASLLVAMTVSPVLCYYLLPHLKAARVKEDSPALRACKAAARAVYRVTLPRPLTVLAICLTLLVGAAILMTRLGTGFLPPFNEGTLTVFVNASPGTSLEESNRIGSLSERLLLGIPEIKRISRRTGRAEQDEHIHGVHITEMDLQFWTEDDLLSSGDDSNDPGRRKPPSLLRSQSEIAAEIERVLAPLPGVFVEISAPLGHRIAQMLSGVRTDVALKIFGEDLDELQVIAEDVRDALETIPGVVDLAVEQQTVIPQLHLKVNRDAAALYGFTVAEVITAFEMATNGKVISEVFEGQRTFDLVVMLNEQYRNSPDRLARMRLISPSGAVVLLRDVAEIAETTGPNQIGREGTQRRIIVSCNIRGRDLGSTVQQIQQTVAAQVDTPQGYYVRLEGTYESQRRGTQTILTLFGLSIVGMFALLYNQLRSVRVVMQVLLNIPFAFIGAVVALRLAGETFNLASLVGFIGLCGIASRNGVLMISHYLHLIREEGLPFGEELVIKGSQERVAPVLMTALTAALALVPLAMQAGQPGKEILYPVAITMIGGLITSTLLDFFVTPTVFLRFGHKAAKRISAETIEA